MKSTFTLFLLLFISFNAISQNKVIDSLKQELTKDIPEKKKAAILFSLSLKTWLSNPEESRIYANKSLDIAVINGFKREEARANSALAISYTHSQDYDKAIAHFNKSIIIAKAIDDKLLLANNYTSFANLYYYKFDYYNAFTYYDKALKIYREIDDIIRAARSLTNISNIYIKTKDYDKALEYVLECDSVLKNNNSPKFALALNYQEIAICYTELKETGLAKEYAKKAIDILENENEDYRAMNAHLTLGNIYVKEKEYKKAYTIFNTNYKKVKSFNNLTLDMRYNWRLSNVLYKLESYEEALFYANKSFEIAKTVMTTSIFLRLVK